MPVTHKGHRTPERTYGIYTHIIFTYIHIHCNYNLPFVIAKRNIFSWKINYPPHPTHENNLYSPEVIFIFWDFLHWIGKIMNFRVKKTVCKKLAFWCRIYHFSPPYKWFTFVFSKKSFSSSEPCWFFKSLSRRQKKYKSYFFGYSYNSRTLRNWM